MSKNLDLGHLDQYEIKNVSWDDLYKIMISLKYTLKIFEKRIADDKTDITSKQQFDDYKQLFDAIEKIHSNWHGIATGWDEQNIMETLAKYKIV